MIAAGIAAVAVAAGGAGYVRYTRLLADEHQAAVQSETANAQLQTELARLRDQLGSANRELAGTQGRLAAITDEMQARNRQRLETERRIAATEEAKGDRLAQLNRTLEQVQRELNVTEAQRATLMARLNKAESDLVDQHAGRAQAQAAIDQWQRRVQQLQTERDKVTGERDELRAKVGRLEQKLSMAQMPGVPAEKPVAGAPPHPARGSVAVASAIPHPAPVAVPQPPVPQPPVAVPQPAPVAAAPVAAAPHVAAAPQVAAAQAAPVAAAIARAPAAAEAAVPRQAAAVVVPRGRTGVGEIERVLASAGVDVGRLFSQFGVTRGEGGPFIPAPGGHAPPTTLTPERLAALRALMKTLPLSAPLTGYEIGSGFGVRHDPFNGRSSFHTGLDFDAPYMSPVYATAAGVVTYAGYRDDYGKIVEIDHGNGISTRYAHLHRYTVSVGQRIAAHTQIGFLGSTGRATGPHVHYEILVNGEPQDPAKFLHLGHIVPVAAQR